MIPCIFAENIGSIWNDSKHKFYDDLHNADVILINEGQFFDDLFKTVLEMVEVKHKKVYICGLDGDFLRNKFGQLTDLIPYCDKLTKLQSLCSVCKNGKKAIFSHRKTQETSQIVIGADNYMPLCRNCYSVMNK
jgi:thymidine kinase